MAKRSQTSRKRKAGNGKRAKGRSTKYEGRKGTELRIADRLEAGRREGVKGRSTKYEDRKGTELRNADHLEAGRRKGGRGILLIVGGGAECRSRKAQWPNKAIWSQAQGRNGDTLRVASRGVGLVAGRVERSGPSFSYLLRNRTMDCWLIFLPLPCACGAARVGATAAVLVGFDDLFEQFHLLSFSNDFWLLDPRTDHLIQMFPSGFWFDVTFAVGAVTLLEGAVVALVGFGYLRWLARAASRRDGSVDGAGPDVFDPAPLPPGSP